MSGPPQPFNETRDASSTRLESPWRSLLRLAILALAAACTTGSVDVPDDTDSDVDSDTVDTEPPPADVDGDGFLDDVDCDDFDDAVFPGAIEIWNDVDDDCDGRIDGDGRFEGTADAVFRAVYEGQPHRWDLVCTVTFDRVASWFDLEIGCSPPEGDDLARALLGEAVSVQERDNVISNDAPWSGVVDVRSTDGWTAAGSGSMRFPSLDGIEGGAFLDTVSLDMTLTFSAAYQPP